MGRHRAPIGQPNIGQKPLITADQHAGNQRLGKMVTHLGRYFRKGFQLRPSYSAHPTRSAKPPDILDVPMGQRPDHTIGLMSAWFTPEPT